MVIINLMNLYGIELYYMWNYFKDSFELQGTSFVDGDKLIVSISPDEILVDADEFECLEEFMQPIREELGIV